MTKQEIILANQQHLFPSVFHYYKEPLVVTKAKNQYVWDIDGNQYLDFFGGIVTISVGHCNETVNKKVHEQIDKLQHVSTVFANEPQAALAKRIAEITPGGKLTKSFFTNSGTEANETAFVTARMLHRQSRNRGAAALLITGDRQSRWRPAASRAWRLGGAAPSGFVHAINANCYRCPFGLEYPSCNVRCARDMEEMIKTSTSGRIAAFMAEPIQGVGGFIVPPKEYFEIVQGIVKKAGGLFISDEVQTGWGRTGGKWFGIEQWGVQPDILTSAKSLGNGAPVGLTVARPEVADAMKGATISTFGGNPVTATQAKAVIDFIDENKLMINAAETGAYLRGKLEEMKGKYSIDRRCARHGIDARRRTGGRSRNEEACCGCDERDAGSDS